MHAFGASNYGAHGSPQRPLPAGSSAPAAARYVQVCLEVLNGFRPPSHLRTLTGPVEFDDILRQLRFRRNAPRAVWTPPKGTASAAPNAAAPHSKSINIRSAPPATQQGPSSRPAGRRAGGPPELNAGGATHAFRLRRLRVAEPLPGVAEVVAVLTQGGQALALAMRLEARGAAWVCTVIQVV
jgi:hypothetical protein